MPETVRRGATANLPATVNVDSDGTVGPVAVTWSALDTSVLGPQTVTGTLAADAHFTAGRTFQRTITVTAPGIANIAPEATVSASSRGDLVGTIVDGNPTGKGWDDWTGNGYPRDSWLAFDWGVTRTFDSIVVHTYKDGPTATWPSRIQAQYRDASGAWVDTEVGATLSQDASTPAPVAVIDARSLPASSALRLRLTSDANTWQSIAEVDVWGDASIPNVCRGGDATVSASFHQTKWATMPAGNACDGKQNTQWSTWTDAGFQDAATFTIETSEIHRLDHVAFTNTEGTIAGVSAEYRTPAGEWLPVVPTGDAPEVVNGTETTLSFTKVLATGLRLTFATPGSYLKIPEIVVPAAGGIAAITPVLDAEPNAAGWFRAPVTVQLSHDGGADVVVQHRIDDGEWVDGTEVTVDTDGAHTVGYRALIDGVEQEDVTGSVAVPVDTVAPVTGADVTAASSARALALPDVTASVAAPGQVLTLLAADATSGVATTEYSLDEGTTWTVGTEVSFTEAGTYRVWFRSTDVAGNVEETRTAELTVTAPGDGGTDPGTTPAPTPSATTPGSTAGTGGTASGTAGASDALALTGTEAPISLAVGAFLALLAGAGVLLLRRRRA